ncbi:MAG TPA: hypothetical protein VFF31_06935 [Blastocatellia bacterium]|nr:hypothetical protein [Blastocatellia bacterium]
MTSFRSRTFTEYLQIIWRRKLLIFLVATGMLISTFLLIERMPNVYESRSTVVTTGSLTDRPAINARVAATTERLTSRGFLEPIVIQYEPYKNVSVDAAVAQLRQDLKIDTTYRSDYPERLTVAYRHTDPAIAKDVTTELVSVFGKMNDAVQKQVADTASGLASEITDVENRLRSIGKLRSATASRRSAAGHVAGALNSERAQRIAAASSIETLTDKQFALEQQIAEQNRQIQEQQRIVKLAPSDARASSSYGVLLVRKAELEGQLKDYGTQYTDKNPKVIQTRNQLGEINHQIAQLNAGADQDSAPVNSAEARELRAMQRELTKMQTELAITQRELNRKKQAAPNADVPIRSAFVPAVAPVGDGGETSAEAQTDYETLRTRYDALLTKQSQLERAQVATAGLDPGVFQVVDEPSVPRIPVGPNRFKYRMFCVALALGLALLIAFALEIPKLYSINDDRDVEYYLGVPVIALIPETVTPNEGKSRRLLLGRVAGAVLIGLLVSAALILMT